jgi:hypothetical protein
VMSPAVLEVHEGTYPEVKPLKRRSPLGRTFCDSCKPSTEKNCSTDRILRATCIGSACVLGSARLSQERGQQRDREELSSIACTLQN